MGKSERLQRELDKTARAKRGAEVVKAGARYERTMRETAQGERVVSMNERVILREKSGWENMMEREKKVERRRRRWRKRGQAQREKTRRR